MDAAARGGAVPTGLVLLWLRPIVNETISHNPGPGERLRGLQHYGDQLVVRGERHFRIAPEVFGRSGAVAVAALILLPVAAFAIRRRWAAFALGGTLIMLVLERAVALRALLRRGLPLAGAPRAGFAPLPFVFVGGCADRAAHLVAAAGARCGHRRAAALAGDFQYGLRHGGPAAATWSRWSEARSRSSPRLLRRPDRSGGARRGRGGLFVLPVVVHGSGTGARAQEDPFALSPRARSQPAHGSAEGRHRDRARQDELPLAAAAPVYVVAAPVTHVADTTANNPYGRARDMRHWC